MIRRIPPSPATRTCPATERADAGRGDIHAPRGTSAHNCLVEVKRYDGPLPDVQVFRQPPMTTADRLSGRLSAIGVLVQAVARQHAALLRPVGRP
jgi:hypothetical protein